MLRKINIYNEKWLNVLLKNHVSCTVISYEYIKHYNCAYQHGICLKFKLNPRFPIFGDGEIDCASVTTNKLKGLDRAVK